MTLSLDYIRKRVGWCPNAQPQMHSGVILPDDNSVIPSARGSFKDRAVHWLGLFRNQMIVLALYFSVVGILLPVLLGGLDAPMFIIGIAAGTLLSVFQGFRFWKTMNEVRDEGAVLLATLYDKSTVTILLIVIMIPMAVSFGAIPGITMTMLNSISGGFVFILFWWVLLVVWRWESQVKCRLQSDGLMLSLAREA